MLCVPFLGNCVLVPALVLVYINITYTFGLDWKQFFHLTSKTVIVYFTHYLEWFNTFSTHPLKSFFYQQTILNFSIFVLVYKICLKCGLWLFCRPMHTWVTLFHIVVFFLFTSVLFSFISLHWFSMWLILKTNLPISGFRCKNGSIEYVHCETSKSFLVWNDTS